MLRWVWAEMGYRLDVCLVTEGEHIESILRYAKKLGEFLFPSVGNMLQSFPPLKFTDFMKCVRKLRTPVYYSFNFEPPYLPKRE
jgi:hypothetical protein